MSESPEFVDGLMDILSYNKDNGVFTWKIHLKNGINAGDIAGYVSAGYIRITIDGEPYMAHRLAWLYVHGEWPKGQIDHINGIKSDNRIENLRCVNHGENMKNKRMRKNNSSGFTGVYFRKDNNRWTAEISVKNKKKKLGCYENLEDAIEARKKANSKYNYHHNHGK